MADALKNTTKSPPPSQQGPSSADIFFVAQIEIAHLYPQIVAILLVFEHNYDQTQ